MADTKISALTALTSPASGDEFAIVDKSDTTMAATGTTKRITYGSLQTDLDGRYVQLSLFDANTILYATSDNTPAALTVGEATVVGRATGGNIAALSIDTDLSTVSASDDTIPSAKAVRAYIDALQGVSRAILEDQKAQNTDGGTFTSGADQTRTLNTEVYDPDGIVSLASNQFTLAAGTYLIEWSAPAYLANRHQSMLYSVTAAAVLSRGTSENGGSGTTIAGRSHGAYVVTPAVSTTYEIRHRCQTTAATNGFGVAANFGTEVYTQVVITKIA